MKKVLKLLVAIILAIVIIGTVMFLIDCSRVKSEKEPIFARETAVYKDGGTVEYMGIGYKIIDFNKINGYDETKIGFWNIKYEDYEEEYKLFDGCLFEDMYDVDLNDKVSGDTLTSGDIISGDTEIIENQSGDVIKNNEESGEKAEVNTSIDEATSGDVEKEEGYYFNATIIGVNKNNLIVQALENDPITASSDMFSFSVKEGTKEYLIGQKVKIKYTGVIRESYPAQIDVLGIEIIE